MSNPAQLSSALILEAAAYLAGRVRRTPVERSPALSERLGVPVWLKLESLQLTGSFKLRGAWFGISRLTAGERRAGVATASAGNHGKAVAYVAREAGMHATIYVPRTVDGAKFRGMLALGAEVIRTECTGYDETEALAREEALRAGQVFLSPFDDAGVMAGNGGSLAVEVLEQVPEARNFILPVGGGGLAAGFSFYAKERYPEAAVSGCQLERSPALRLSLEAGAAVTRLPAIVTDAGGLEGGLGRNTFEILKTRIAQVALVSEAEIHQAVRWMLEEHQYLVEPSAAAVLAACLADRVGVLREPAVVVVSGRNVDLATVRKILGP